MEKGYRLLKENDIGCGFVRDNNFTQRFLEFKGEAVLVWQKQDRHSKCTIVPGYITSEIYETPSGVKVVKCEPI
ncbi:MAG: hypothetical protein KKA64_03355 [Nanoarchaeota archaeon]|nr:hypothetical protein [Nanoarchaeota archaeon]